MHRLCWDAFPINDALISRVIPSEVEEPLGVNLQLFSRDPSTPLRSAQNDTLLRLSE
jgi:hypothetical protein